MDCDFYYYRLKKVIRKLGNQVNLQVMLTPLSEQLMEEN